MLSQITTLHATSKTDTQEMPQFTGQVLFICTARLDEIVAEIEFRFQLGTTLHEKTKYLRSQLLIVLEAWKPGSRPSSFGAFCFDSGTWFPLLIFAGLFAFLVEEVSKQLLTSCTKRLDSILWAPSSWRPAKCCTFTLFYLKSRFNKNFGVQLFRDKYKVCPMSFMYQHNIQY